MSSAAAAPAVACEKCLRPGDVQVGTPAGRYEQVAGVDCYVTGDNKEAAIIYCTDIFGYKFINHQLLADKYAAGGFTVVIPNTLKTGPMSTDGYSVYAMEKFFAWFPDNPIEFGVDVATRVATQLKTDYPKGVQGVGFCIGARLVVDLITKHSLLKAGVLHHPTFLNEQDVPLINVPMLFNLASREEIFAPELRAKFEERLTKEVPGSKFIDYPGTEHGFGARPEGEEAHKSSAEAAVNSVAFFQQHK